jgi:3D (Asp-Asp-Asp) domain-containing protein
LSGENTSVYITFYGWNDNDPPGTDIAYPKSDYPASVHNSAGGSGSFNDPVSFASDPKLFPVGTIIYVPYLKKYAVMEDYCATCVRDNNQGKKHIDIWAGGNGSNEAKLIACEEDWTRESENILLNSQNGMEVNLTPIFDSGSAVCLN